jgi:uncharacterized membrane protein
MGKLFGGILSVVAGILVATIAFYYAWASGTPDFPAEVYRDYQFYSLIFTIFSVVMILGGMYMSLSSIRKMNRDYRDSRKN